MKNFYTVKEPYSGEETQEVYEKNKRKTVLETIKPICEAFEIKDFDYIIDRSKGTERLVIEGQAIGCMDNSIGATVTELIGYIFAQTWLEDRCFENKEQFLEKVKYYWIKGE